MAEYIWKPTEEPCPSLKVQEPPNDTPPQKHCDLLPCKKRMTRVTLLLCLGTIGAVGNQPLKPKPSNSAALQRHKPNL